MQVRLELPSGSMENRIEHDATMALERESEGTFLASYEELALRFRSPMGNVDPNTDPLISVPFVVEYDGAGSFAALEHPSMPPEVAAISDLTQQFRDYLLPMPDSRPETGVIWTDTIEFESRNEASGQFTSAVHVRQFVVREDTVTAMGPGTIIDVIQEVTMEGEAPADAQGTMASTTLAGIDAGFVVFDFEVGRMRYRARTAELTGTTRIGDGPAAMQIDQTLSYESTISLTGGG